MAKKKISITIDEEQLARLKEHCSFKKISISRYIRDLLDSFLPPEMKIKRLSDDWVFRNFKNE